MNAEHASAFDSVQEAIDDIAAGKLVIVTDDENRENEGDLIMAASKATSEAVNMMIRYGSGIVCVPTIDAQLRRLGLNSMVQQNREVFRTDFTVSVDATEGVSTGISASDRTAAIRVLSDPKASPGQLVQPGHVFPLRARPGGVLERAGHTEAAVDLARLAGLHPSGVICELMNEDGSVMRLPELLQFKKTHGLKIISIASLIAYRHHSEKLVERLGATPFSCAHGDFQLHVYRSTLDGRCHFALSLGQLDARPTLVRVQSENILGDVFGATDSHGQAAMKASLEHIKEAGSGVLLYIEQLHGGVDIAGLQESSEASTLKPTPMDLRDYGVGAQILADLGLERIRLLTHAPRNIVALDGYGLEIVEQINLSNS